MKLRVRPIMAAKGREPEQEAAGYIKPAIRKQKMDRMSGLDIKTPGLLLLTKV